ncbi:Scr1 family TA system antitoxin-like transcriptional regulator [Lentzea sp. JNUCC 0626]|uniref:Scr1 family TA system antitoxin-like transcriptional regulator n=1 Tax=Lentzea sp. JNUCC 0626 TaxID=3367513 RepID=UPI003748EC99
MTVYIRPSMAERSIGRNLWKWRDETGMSLAEACEEAGFSTANLSMMENALRPFDPLNIMILGRVYNIPNEVWKRQIRRAEAAARERRQAKTKQSAYDLDATEDLIESYLDATSICAYGADAIPHLLQTSKYSAALSQPEGRSRTSLGVSLIKDLAADGSSNPTVDVVVTMQAIRRVAGSAEVTNAALAQLVSLSELDCFTIQLLSDDEHSELLPQSSYCHLAFPHDQHDDVVYLEEAGRGRYIEDSTACQLIQSGFRALQRRALSPADSVEAIAEAASTLRTRPSRMTSTRTTRARKPSTAAPKGS